MKTLTQLTREYDKLIALSLIKEDEQECTLDEIESIIYTTCNLDVAQEACEAIEKLKEICEIAMNILCKDAETQAKLITRSNNRLKTRK